MRVERDASGITAALSRTVEGLGRLVSDHLTLARLEIVEDARGLGKDLARLALFVPPVIVGWGLACAALAVALAPWLTLAGALLLVGAVNLGAGGWGLLQASARMRQRKVMDDTLDEVERSANVLTTSTEAGHGR